MQRLFAYIKILRVRNAAMATGAVFLGAWIGESVLPWSATTLLATAALLSTGFGNVINDIFDLETDRISHPERPLPMELISRRAATIYAVVLAAGALICAFPVALLYGYATLAPIFLLTIYAFFLKKTPLAGNIIVSLLVAYSLLFGALEAPEIGRLFIPALLAMLLNFTREIIKDVQDEAGDQAAGITTTAILSHRLLLSIIYGTSLIYLLLLYVPCISGTATRMYALAVTLTALPVHLFRLHLLRRDQLTVRLSLKSSLVKIEMLAGLLALSLDHLFR